MVQVQLPITSYYVLSNFFVNSDDWCVLYPKQQCVHREEITSHLTHQVVCTLRIDPVKVDLVEDVMGILETINKTIKFSILVGSKQADNFIFLRLS